MRSPGETLIVNWRMQDGLLPPCGTWMSRARPIRTSASTPRQRLERERRLLTELPSLLPEFSTGPTNRKGRQAVVYRLPSGRYSVPNRLIGKTVKGLVDDRMLWAVEPVTGELFSEHTRVAPGGPALHRGQLHCSPCAWTTRWTTGHGSVDGAAAHAQRLGD